MESFIKNIELINNYLNKIQENYIIDSKVINKQLLVYYLYRIFCKFIELFKINTDIKKVNKILRLLKITTDFKKCAPLVNKIPTNIKELNVLYRQLINIFKDINKNMKNLNSLGDKNLLIYFKELIDLKSDKEKVKEDLIVLSTLVPELGKLERKPSLKF